MDADNYRILTADLQAQDPRKSKVQKTSKDWPGDNPLSEEVSLFCFIQAFQLKGPDSSHYREQVCVYLKFTNLDLNLIKKKKSFHVHM